MTPGQSEGLPLEIVLVAAMGENRVIGTKGGMPWHLAADLKRFKALTLGSSIVLGRKTLESFGGRLLAKRRHHVVSRSPGNAVHKDDGTSLEWHVSLEEALRACAHAGERKVFVVGGGQIYEEALRKGLVTSVELTRIALSPEGDTMLAPFEGAFRLVGEEGHAEDGIAFRYETWVRI